MDRTTTFIAGLVFALAPFALAQEPRESPFPEDSLVVQQLIHWSRYQQPQPAPQPAPPRDPAVPSPDQQDQQGKQPGDPQNPSPQTPATQAFTGKIVRDGDKLMLKVGINASYELEDAGNAAQYENQTVKVIGTLDTTTNTIRVVKIELLS